MRDIAVFLLGVAVFSLLISWFFIKRHRTLAKIAIDTPMSIHAVTKVVIEDTASRVALSSERSLTRGSRFFYLALCSFVGAIECSFKGPLIWAGQSALDLLSIGWWIPSMFLCLVVASSVSFFFLIAYDVFFDRLGKVEPKLKLKRVRHCSSCQKPFKKYAVKALDILNDVELAEYQAGTIQYTINTELCPSCSLPLTRQTLDLRIFPMMRDESASCPQCKNYTFTKIEISPPIRAEQMGESGYKNSKRECHYCGYQVQRQPRITLSFLESTIQVAIDHHDLWKGDCQGLMSEIEQMIQCDETKKDRFKERYKLIDDTYFRGGIPSFRELKYLSTDDLRNAIEFISKYIQEKRAYEKDVLSSNF